MPEATFWPTELQATSSSVLAITTIAFMGAFLAKGWFGGRRAHAHACSIAARGV
jgi:hypothetical protein